MTKKVNYTDEQVATLKAGYDMEADAETRKAQVTALAVEIDKSEKQVIAKLSNMKHYVSKVYTNKQGNPTVRKGAISDMIAAVMGETAESFETLSKANKTVLEAILAYVQPEEVVENDSQEEPEVMEEAETA